MTRLRFLTLAVALGATGLVGCDGGFGPLDELELLVSAPDFVELGDTVALVGVAYNGSSTPVTTTSGCGPGIGFLMEAPGSPEVDLYAGLGFTCQLRDSNLIEPGETDVVEWMWTPTVVGLHRVRSRVTADGFTRVSAWARVQVVDPR